MSCHTVKIEDTDYRYLEQAAAIWGISVQDMLGKIIEQQRVGNRQISEKLKLSKSIGHKKSRWAEMSGRIRKNPPLREVGEYVRESAKDFREDFSFRHDTE